jgi:hypothetical protein
MSRSHKDYKTGELFRLLGSIAYLSIGMFVGDDAKNFDKLDNDENDEIVYPTTDKEVKNENEIPVTRSLLALNGKPFSAVHNDVLVKYFDEAPEK